MFWLRILAKLVKALRAGESPNQIAGGFSIGFLIGLMPFWTLQGVGLFIVLILLDINIAAGMLAILLAGGFAYLLDPMFHHLGFWLLVDVTMLHGLWEAIYNTPILPFSRFNNTVVMGSLLIGSLAVVPVFFGAKKFVIAYREHLEQRILKWKVVQAIRGSALVRWYVRIRSLGGD